MNKINELKGLDDILERQNILLFLNETWSEYAKKGMTVLKEIADSSYQIKNLTFWSVNFSEADREIVEWLKNHSQSINLIPAATTGNGSMIWIKDGKVIDFTLSLNNEVKENILNKIKHTFTLQ